MRKAKKKKKGAIPYQYRKKYNFEDMNITINRAIVCHTENCPLGKKVVHCTVLRGINETQNICLHSEVDFTAQMGKEKIGWHA